jgi:hypothetical protein
MRPTPSATPTARVGLTAGRAQLFVPFAFGKDVSQDLSKSFVLKVLFYERQELGL